jgi:hypothetical protein
MPSPSSAACILVVAPPSLCNMYAGTGSARAGVLCVTQANEIAQHLDSSLIAAVVCHESPALSREAVTALATWYQRRRGERPLLAFVGDLGLDSPPSMLQAHASLLFSCYHSKPEEIIALLQQWAFPAKNAKIKNHGSTRLTMT